MMSVQSRAYTPPSAAQLALARQAFGALRRGRPALAAPQLRLLGFDLVELHDSDSNQRYFIAQERPDQPVAGWGWYAINPRPRTPYVVQAPHPLNDRLTDLQSGRLMSTLGARALLVSTAYRCATPRASRCSGRTYACEGKRRLVHYRMSDVAHTQRSIFHVAHEVLYAESATVVLQLHGFDRRPGRRLHVILSNGTARPAGPRSISNRVARTMRAALPTRELRRAVVSCNSRSGLPLCGTDNVQGRQANGSTRPCRRDARRSRNRFLHIEQSATARARNGLLFAALTRALLELRRPWSVPRR